MLYLVHARPELCLEVISFDKDRNVLVGRRSDGTVLTDPNFHVYMAKRCGYSLTQSAPPNFKGDRHAIES